MTEPDTRERVFVFLDSMPQRQGSGASLRFYSNIQAYLDLGFDVEVIQVATVSDGSEPSDDLKPVVWKRIFEPDSRPSILGSVLYRAGIATRDSAAYYFSKHHLVFRETQNRLKRHPDAFYHFEGESMANVIPWLPKQTRSIWSLHDLPSTVAEATIKIRTEAQNREPTIPEQRELKFARRIERFMARHSPAIFCIADHDSEHIRKEWGCSQVEYLPMSIPGDGADRLDGFLQDGTLRMLHLGRISHLPSYRSLEFLLGQVFPLLSDETIARLRLDVVGRVDREDDRAKKILLLAEQFKNISFHGFVDDVMPYYQLCDLQVVGSTDASGLRTRTIESFAYGLPVLSTDVGAKGIGGLTAGEDLLIANTPHEFARALTELIRNPETLESLSRNGRKFYQRNQSRAVVSSVLASYLEKYF